ncbi:nuclear transport factor 2 (NTF2) family protein [Citrus sinensis]|uniref:Nuclear transport factor 2 (NTF2) family protein n=1 Tax=Citrus sinensis TaxID=2711 RepID=A0ACB8JP11_CITSI|nr:nuclear transport factor 2 (NTF2) family protein [Citrus sinensis]
MAAQAESSAKVDPQLVGNSFVEQYFKALHQYPEHLHRFYQDSSFLSRPGPDGVMTSITTMKEINDQILSLDYQNYQTEILTVDAQASYCKGVLVLVTGYMSGKTGKRRFSQSFFLAPQENGFFVLNDIFRFVDDDLSVGMVMPINDVDKTAAPVTTSVPESEAGQVANHSVPNHTRTTIMETAKAAKTTLPDEVITKENDKKISETLPQNDHDQDNHSVSNQTSHDQDNHSVSNQTSTTTSSAEAISTTTTNNVNRPAETSSHDHLHKKANDHLIPEKKSGVANHDHPPVVSEIKTPRTPDSSSRKSFASIVHALKDNSSPFQNKVPPPNLKKGANTTQSSADPFSNNALRNNIDDQAAKNPVIFVANLPMDVTADQIKSVFVKFGPIKANGIRIRTNQLRPNCFSFVEFESISSMQNALKASPITFGGNEAVSVRRNVGSTSQNDNVRGRVNANGRINNAQAAVATGRGAGESPRTAQKANQNDGVRGGRQGQVDKK